MSLFGPNLLKRLRYLSMVARRMGESPLLAAPRKKVPGGGTEVTGYRDYAPGDDWLQIYWTWCARRDELLVKVYEGEVDRHMYLLLDCSPSMGLGHPPKFHTARQVAAALAYVSLWNLDRLGIAAFADALVGDLPPLRHQSRYPRLLRFLERLSPCGARSDLARSVKAFVRRHPRPGPIIVLSDLYDPDGFQRGFDLLRYHGYEPRLVHLVDPQELHFNLLGDVEFLDVQTQTVRQVTVTERAAARYGALVAEFRRSVADYCRRRGMVYMQIACDAPEDDLVLRVLGARRDGDLTKPRPVTSVP